MSSNFKSVHFIRKQTGKSSLDLFGTHIAKKTHRFHSSFDEYTETPLVSLDSFAQKIGVNKVYVKDESYRFGLNAFKVLGGSYAIGQYIANKLNEDIDNLPYSKMISKDVKEILGDMTFVTATDGNHGRGVAWTANKLAQKSVVFMPKGSAIERLNNIKAQGADASITDMNYDEAVRLANSKAEEFGWVMVQDTAWEGYTDIPTWIMQGYTTMAYEAYTKLLSLKEKPTHIFLQAGVGSLAGAVTGFFSSVYGEERPIITIIEPNKADCIFRTAEKNDGNLYFVTGDMDTIMAGLACGEPATIAWEVLKDYADNFLSVPDYVSANGMRILASPSGDDTKIISGESGAVGVGLIAEIMENSEISHIKAQLNLDENSKILFFNTEGDTDKANYKEIVWNGKYSKYDDK